MKTYALDFESYYDSDCSITTLGPRGYFSHPDFDAYMVTIACDDGYQFAGNPKDFNWSLLNGNIVLSHNASFDQSLYLYGCEVGWWDKVTPAEWHCTADMVAFLGLPRSLKNASAAVFNLEVLKTTRDNMKGKQWSSMTDDFKKEVTEYAIVDAVLCLRLWKELSDGWPVFERRISTLNRLVGQRGLPMDLNLLQANLETITTTLFDVEQSIPWIADYTPLSRKAFNEQCRKEGIVPPVSLAAGNEDTEKWFAEYQNACPWAKSVQNFRRVNAFLRKLESFDAGTMPDGRYYGGLMYFGSTTGRFSGSGGNANLQNLPRGEMFGVDLRNMIRPTADKKLVIVDLSQIEVRTLCWLAKDRKALDMIRDSKDIYHAFGVLLGLHDPKNGELKDYNSELRSKIKAIVLGCFEPDTLVLTESGWKPILYLDLQDRVWDGIEWVNHKGIICQGVQPTIRKYGVGATADHAIQTEHGWREWNEVVTNPIHMESAIKSVILPYSNGPIKIDRGTLRCNVGVGGSVLWIDTTSNPEKQPDVIRVPNKNLPNLIEIEMVTLKSSVTVPLENECSTASPLVYKDDTTQKILSTGTMEVAEFLYSMSGERTGKNSLSTYPISKDGITLNYSSTESITIGGTNQIISGSSLDLGICRIEEPLAHCSVESQSLKRRSKVYDVSFAGPRNRFTILTDAGPMIVHNCGYGMGPNKFSGFSGMPMSEAESSVQLYRKNMKKVVELWREYDTDMTMSCNLNVPFEIDLPSGRSLKYGVLRRMRDEKTGKFRHIGKLVRNGQLRDFHLWGGIATENASQGLARDIFSDMMLRIDEAGHKIVLHVHDEVVIECDADKAEAVLADVIRIMSEAPDWISDIPLSAEGKISDCYTK